VPTLQPQAIALSAIVALAFVVEASLGFGATVVAVGLGTLLLPLGPLLAAFLPLNVVLSAVVLRSDRRHVAWRTLLRDVLPRMAIGFPLGLLATRALPERATLRAFGAFVVALALVELTRRRRADGDAPPSASPLPTAARTPLLLLAGAMHGAFGVGGPLVVFVAQRELTDKSAFRGTLAALWLLLNLALVASLAAQGAIDRGTLPTLALLAPSTAIGLVAGGALHRALPARAFRSAVLAVLLAVGAFRALHG
jgi:hypothetical protein